MIGTRYNSWTILEDLKHDKWGCRIVRCQCVCGLIKDKRLYAIQQEKSKQCNDCFKGPSLSGSRFGSWTIGEKVYMPDRQEWYYKCFCDCGKIGYNPSTSLKSGKSKGCITCGNKLAHGKTDALRRNAMHRLYDQMMRRCYDRNNCNYKNYGARGIKVCPDWLIFDNFLADMGEKPVGLSLDRINNNGNYEPSNCKWSTVKEQANNRRTSRKYKE